MWCSVAGKVGPLLNFWLLKKLWDCYGTRAARGRTSPAGQGWLLTEETWGYQTLFWGFVAGPDQAFLPRLYLHLQGPL